MSYATRGLISSFLKFKENTSWKLSSQKALLLAYSRKGSRLEKDFIKVE